MKQLWQIYETLALSADVDPLIEISAEKFQELLFSIPHSDQANPRRDIPDAQDWNALK